MNPVFIVSVPRSGSTMLRMVLDSHPSIFSGVELPWIGGNYRSHGYGPEVSLRCLYRRIVNSVAETKCLDKEAVKTAFRIFLRSAIEPQLAEAGKDIWIEKTPGNIINVPFLADLFPKAKFIRVLRDGRDVALSTLKVEGWGLNYFVEANPKNLRLIHVRLALTRRLFTHVPSQLREILFRASLEPATDSMDSVFFPIPKTFFNALYRWREWNDIYEKDAKKMGICELTVRYEDLLHDPGVNLNRICDFVGVDWDDQIINYGKYSHQVRQDDVGVASALKCAQIDSSNAYKWRSSLSERMRRLVRRHFDDYLEHAGYERTP